MAFKFGELLAAAAERFTNALKVITTDHSYIHDKKAFTISGRIATIAASATYTFSFRTPATGKYIHWRPASLVALGNTVEGRLSEGAEVTAGTVVKPFNRSRVGTIPESKVVTKIGATLTTEGGAIFDYLMAGSGGAPAASRSSKDGAEQELVLKPDTVYAYRIENIGTISDAMVVYNFMWYEEDQGE